MKPSRKMPTRMAFDPVPIRGEPLSATIIQQREERDDQLAGLPAKDTRLED
ncbi:MAG TPA: hypothetical protein VML01_05215 [Bryobacterales bacterium]|nr:hypothetical protein [Bryobacterales bacterium]